MQAWELLAVFWVGVCVCNCEDSPGRVPWLQKALLSPFLGQLALGSLSSPVGTMGLCEGWGDVGAALGGSAQQGLQW